MAIKLRRLVGDAIEFLREWPVYYSGKFGTWEGAKAQCTGYESPIILERVLEGSLKVKRGEAAFERDSVAFASPEIDAPLLTALNYVVAETGGRLRVLDFGGALGSAYWQSKHFLSPKIELTWDVVEQPHFVKAGKEHFSDTPLRFFNTIAEAEAVCPHDIIIASGVIQYLKDPYWLSSEIETTKIPFAAITRVNLQGWGDYIAVQKVPASIYPASYPIWLLGREPFVAKFGPSFDIVFEVHSRFREGLTDSSFFLKRG